MKKYLLIVLVLILLGCQKEEVKPKNLTPGKCLMTEMYSEDGRVYYKYNDHGQIQYVHDDKDTTIIYNYEGDRIVSMVMRDTVKFDVYYNKNGLIESWGGYGGFNDLGEYVVTSTEYEYVGDKVVRVNSITNGVKDYYQEYIWTGNNVTKVLGYNLSNDNKFELESMLTIEHDDKINPMIIYSNTPMIMHETISENNILKITDHQYSQNNRTFSYEYNSEGYPVKYNGANLKYSCDQL